MSEQVTARLSNEGTKDTLKLCINVTVEHVEKYGLETKKFVTAKIYKGQPNKYLIQAHDKKLPGVHPWQISPNKKKGKLTGGTIILDPVKFGLVKDEKILGVCLNAEAIEEGLVIELDPNNFSPKAREITRIQTKEDKVSAGFIAPSAWGEVVQLDIEAAIVQRIEDHMFRKYGGKRL